MFSGFQKSQLKQLSEPTKSYAFKVSRRKHKVKDGEVLGDRCIHALVVDLEFLGDRVINSEEDIDNDEYQDQGILNIFYFFEEPVADDQVLHLSEEQP